MEAGFGKPNGFIRSDWVLKEQFVDDKKTEFLVYNLSVSMLTLPEIRHISNYIAHIYLYLYICWFQKTTHRVECHHTFFIERYTSPSTFWNLLATFDFSRILTSALDLERE